MAGASNLQAAPYPNGPYHLMMGAHVPNGHGAGSGKKVQVWIAPFDCTVHRVTKSYISGTAHLDAVSIKTIDATAKNVVLAGPLGADTDESADVEGGQQTLHADIIGFVIKRGDGLILTADSAGANESGYLFFQIELMPVYSRPHKP
jgi:hypothetical protein